MLIWFGKGPIHAVELEKAQSRENSLFSWIICTLAVECIEIGTQKNKDYYIKGSGLVHYV
jgi:hypothetical protein